MKITLLLDRHLEDRGPYLQAGLREMGWDNLLTLNLEEAGNQVARETDENKPLDCDPVIFACRVGLG